jgi:hypothetical protein
VDAYAEQHYEDRSTAPRQLVDFALRELQKREHWTPTGPVEARCATSAGHSG